MDTSETYVKMCEKAEIQYQWARYSDNHDYYADEMIEAGWGCWLPRQDQLQKGSGLSWQDFDGACLGYYEAPSKEQAGIQVWMEKYNKTWNGEDWIPT